ncbi:beta-ketoacyl-ACP synthase [Microbulbifer bruguierae]|uniref:Beta-ketoacyl-ACP synthase n=1 Tax=Microbulbifer bruguierae TaxID=3029061 RepID=A0ABY8NBV3_9GAMM|nr:beta-ketoacyl-ACP synthase [Microbulbifer bruguierae]WGL15272.1 beta-ketoacyl-ACP synthase [Microbulbifer bruguierae]
MPDYYLNHMSLACALGITAQGTAGKDADIVSERLFRADVSAMEQGSSWLGPLYSRFGRVATELPQVPEHLAEYDCRNNRLAQQVATSLQSPIAELVARYGSARIGVVMGTSTSGIASGEQRLAGEGEKNYRYRYQQQMAALAEYVARFLQLTDGPRLTVSTACSSSANAFASARRLLAMNVCDAVVVGGVDTLCGMTVTGFNGLGALSGGHTRPFCGDRDGINLGEAGAMFIMSREPGPVRLCGVAASSDAHHMSAPDPEGRGAEAAMRGALRDAGLAPADIGYLNLHGTGTPQNDVMEARAVSRLFGTAVPCSSTKPLTGHTLGAAGALEAAFCWLALTRGQLPPHCNADGFDPELPPLNLVREGATSPSPRYVMSNSFAFGGSNCSLILGN